MLTKPMPAGTKQKPPKSTSVAAKGGESGYDELLFERLRALRKGLADERGVPPYIVFGDTSLRQLARQYPRSEADFLRISGVGERKLQDYGAAFLAEIGEFLRTSQRLEFAT